MHGLEITSWQVIGPIPTIPDAWKFEVMYHPYQLLSTARPERSGPQFLLAASGHKLIVTNLTDGSIVDCWPKEDANVKISNENPEPDVEGPPAKRRKTASANGHNELPSIISLTVTHSENHVIVGSAEDKNIRVFSISPDGQLEQLSARAMPKRPCSITVTPDDRSILSADKFGDVYSLPLLMISKDEEAFLKAQAQKLAEAKVYEPAATELTVHSKANRKALESQLAQAKEKLAAKTKEALPFSHKLELGHISMLTDVLAVNMESTAENGKVRTYILTSDRDEHIRISRGPPQAHVIEGYCLGHQQFVSTLCLAEPSLLVSGGGDDDLFVWDWLKQSLVNRVHMRDAVRRASLHVGKPTETEQDEAKIAVSGIYKMASSSGLPLPLILFTCENVPAVFHLPVASLRTIQAGAAIGFIPLAGNALSIAIFGMNMLVSVDTVHKPSINIGIDASEVFEPRIQAFELVEEDLNGCALWKPSEHLDRLLIDINKQTTVEWHEKKLQALLYSVEPLRKRHGEDEASNAD